MAKEYAFVISANDYPARIVFGTKKFTKALTEKLQREADKSHENSTFTMQMKIYYHFNYYQVVRQKKRKAKSK